MDATNTIAIAQELLGKYKKKELTAIARKNGWKGDEARAPMLQIALYVATKLAESGKSASDLPSSRDSSKDVPDDKPAEQAQGESDEAQGEQAQAGEGEAQGESDEAQGEAGEADGEGEGEQSDEGEQESSGPDEKTESENSDEGKTADPENSEAEKQNQSKDEAESQQSGEQQQQQPQQPPEYDEEPPEQSKDELDAEWKALIKASNIAMPHRLLRKVWLLSAKAKLNVLLVGPAGSGKTTIAEQLAQLLGVMESGISCSGGMSESNFVGRTMPVNKDGSWDYVPSPMITCLEQPSVYLLDDIDRADANVLVMLHQLLANGRIHVAQKLVNPTVYKHKDCCFIAGANRVGSLGSAIYSEAGELDGATLDRFIIIEVPYDRNYIKAGFKSGKVKPKSAMWTPSAPATDEQIEAAGEWFMKVFDAVQRNKIERIFATRARDKLLAAMRVGVSFEEAKADIVADWSKDELARAGV